MSRPRRAAPLAVLGALLAGAALCGAPAAFAQAYPSRPIHLVVPYPAGGGGDIHGRLIGEKLSPALGQPIVIDNRAGGSGVTGSEYVAKSPPDGYTLLVNTNALVVSQVTGKASYDAVRDFAPVSLTMTSQNMLVARAALPVGSVKELIAYAKANPGKLNYGASGLSTPMLSVELFKSLAGINILFIPYKGDAPGITDLLGGHIDMYVTNIAPLQAHAKAGTLKALAVTSKKRAASLPEVPTMEEAGVPGFEMESWFGVLAPPGTPRAVIDRLNAAIARVLAMPDTQQKIADSGGLAAGSTPEQFAHRIQGDVDKFTQIIKTAGIKVE